MIDFFVCEAGTGPRLTTPALTLLALAAVVGLVLRLRELSGAATGLIYELVDATETQAADSTLAAAHSGG